LFKFEKAFEFADEYKVLFENTLRACGVKFKNSDKKEGSILTFAIKPISSTMFYDLVDKVQESYPDIIGIGLACGGDEDVLIDDTDQCEVTFRKWMTLHSRSQAVVFKDSNSPLPQAVFCNSLTKRGLCCKNKTKDSSKRCWRHRGQCMLVPC
jgi:hypothetical protein